MYDPRDKGADCDNCPLGPNGIVRKRGFFGRFAGEEWSPMPSECRNTPNVIIIDSPTAEDEKYNYPFSRRDGVILQEALEEAEFERTDFSIIPLISCRIPGDNKGSWNRLSIECSRSEVEHPSKFCNPRFESELGRRTNVITVGNAAAQRMTMTRKSLEKYLNEPMTILASDTYHHHADLITARGNFTIKLFPTYTRGMLMAAAKYIKPFKLAAKKAKRFFDGSLHWVEHDKHFQPTPEEFYEYLSRKKEVFISDVETDNIEPMIANLRDIGFALPAEREDGTYAMPGEVPHVNCKTIVATVELKEESARPYGDERRECPCCHGYKIVMDGTIEVPCVVCRQTGIIGWGGEEDIMWIMISFFLRTDTIVAGHNFGYYDKLNIEYVVNRWLHKNSYTLDDMPAKWRM
jgi:hypothetical protein